MRRLGTGFAACLLCVAADTLLYLFNGKKGSVRCVGSHCTRNARSGNMRWLKAEQRPGGTGGTALIPSHD
jgi:hypothetical protein